MRKARILLVDDEIGAARQLKNNLELCGRYEVRVENWAEDALSAAREFMPDLIVLDIIMPRLPGGNVAEALANDLELKAIPVVFFTAAVRRHQVEDHEGIICDHPCLAKPAKMEEILAFIEANLPPQWHTERAMPPPIFASPAPEDEARVSS